MRGKEQIEIINALMPTSKQFLHYTYAGTVLLLPNSLISIATEGI